MKSSLQLLGLLAASVACAQPTTPADAPPRDQIVGPPAKNWVLPLYTDKEGFHTMTLRGSEAHAIGSKQIDITDLHITSFSGDATSRVDTVLLAPQAHFFPDEKRAAGEKAVRVIRDDMEITGERWTFVQAEKRVLIHQNVRVVLHGQLPAILK